MNKTDSNNTMTPLPIYLTDKREELTEFLKSKLIECGWRDQVANSCRELIQKHGVEQIRLEDIINEVRPAAREKVPEQVKTELLEKIRKMTPACVAEPQPENLAPELAPILEHQSMQQDPQQQQTEQQSDSINNVKQEPHPNSAEPLI